MCGEKRRQGDHDRIGNRRKAASAANPVAARDRRRPAEKSSAAPRAAVPRALWSGATRHSRRCPSPGLGREQSTSFGLWTSRVIFFLIKCIGVTLVNEII